MIYDLSKKPQQNLKHVSANLMNSLEFVLSGNNKVFPPIMWEKATKSIYCKGVSPLLKPECPSVVT